MSKHKLSEEMSSQDVELNLLEIELRSTLQKLCLPTESARALYEFAIDPHGIEQRAAPTLIASVLDIHTDIASHALIDLLGRNLLVRDDSGKETRLLADYAKLNIDNVSLEKFARQHECFENQREPHSKRAMEALEQFFDDSEDTIYLALEMTSKHIFWALERRAEKGRLTVFLMPRRADIPESRRMRHDEVLKEWLHIISNGPAALRKNIRIRITRAPFPDLYTSAVSRHKARFDVYFYQSMTTLRGKILEIKNGTSLYDMICARYREAIRLSYPLWQIWWGEALVYWGARLILPSVLLGGGVWLATFGSPLLVSISAVAIGLLSNLLSPILAEPKSWIRQELFRK